MRRLLVVAAVSSVLVALPAGAAAGEHRQRLPDLTPSRLKVHVDRGGDGCSLSFSVTVKNTGRADAGAYVSEADIILDGVPLVAFPLFADGTRAHGKTVLSSSFDYIAGTYQVAISVNSFNPIPESDFGNNFITSKPFACPRTRGH